jgi:WD40 repeat protein
MLRNACWTCIENYNYHLPRICLCWHIGTTSLHFVCIFSSLLYLIALVYSVFVVVCCAYGSCEIDYKNEVWEILGYFQYAWSLKFVQFFVGGNDKNAVVFNKDTEQVVAILQGHTKKVTGVIYHPDEVKIVCSNKFITWKFEMLYQEPSVTLQIILQYHWRYVRLAGCLKFQFY